MLIFAFSSVIPVAASAAETKNGGYIVVDNDGFITLTDVGLEVAAKIYDRHMCITDFLIKIGVSPCTAADDACKIEHDISDESFEAIRNYMKK